LFSVIQKSGRHTPDPNVTATVCSDANADAGGHGYESQDMVSILRPMRATKSVLSQQCFDEKAEAATAIGVAAGVAAVAVGAGAVAVSGVLGTVKEEERGGDSGEGRGEVARGGGLTRRDASGSASSHYSHYTHYSHYSDAAGPVGESPRAGEGNTTTTTDDARCAERQPQP
jgi:hypothetical protein